MPRISGSGVLVIHDGGLPSLVACLLAEEPSDVVAFSPPIGSPCLEPGAGLLQPAHRRATRQQADLLCLRGVEESDPRREPTAGAQPSLTTLLMDACAAAFRLNCATVVWPVVSGDQHERLSLCIERARLVTRLVNLPDSDPPTAPAADFYAEIALPLVDLTMAQVADLAFDLDAPIESSWWHAQEEIASQEGAVDLRLAWGAALREAARSRSIPWAGFEPAAA